MTNVNMAAYGLRNQYAAATQEYRPDFAVGRILSQEKGINQVANVSTPDARTIAIRPWDKKTIRDIEKAIMDSDVGITPENNGEIIRLGIPQPTEERRRELAKQCNKIGEKAKVEVRNVRSDVKDKLKKAIKDGLSEDNEKDAELELQKIHDKYIKKLDDLLAAKNKEIMTV